MDGHAQDPTLKRGSQSSRKLSFDGSVPIAFVHGSCSGVKV
jgi:hypothetical protein